VTECPHVPKRLASRIRAAQRRVESARIAIVSDEQRIEQDATRIAEYERSPAQFAEKHYHGLPVDSYPVQTNISRCRESLEYRTSRRSLRWIELEEAEKASKQVETEVLQELTRMRANTPGRVPWPPKLPSFADFRAQWAHEWEQMTRQFEAERAADLAEFERLMAEEEAERLERERREDEEFKRQLRAMSPEAKAKWDLFKEEVKAGKVTVFDVIEHFSRKK
jgi:hypothetical protein